MLIREYSIKIEQRAVKRLIDIVFSLLLIIITSPIMLITAIIIKAYDHAAHTDNPLPSICYGDINECRTGQRVASNPVINDFACYRNIPCHQACFYEVSLILQEKFDTQWQVRADYEHFLRCYYRDKAQTFYLPMNYPSIYTIITSQMTNEYRSYLTSAGMMITVMLMQRRSNRFLPVSIIRQKQSRQM